MLQNIVIYVQKKWKLQAENFRVKMQASGISESQVFINRTSQISESQYFIGQDLWKYDIQSSVLITDDKAVSGEWKRRGGVSIGCTEESEFFDGAELVTDSLEELDEIMLEEILLRGLGLPVTIAETERLIIREITKGDVEALYEISMQAGMEYLMDNRTGDNCFEPERMWSYIENVYRFYGYGLWSVWTKEGQLIGCCGLSEFERRTSNPPLQMRGALSGGNDGCKVSEAESICRSENSAHQIYYSQDSGSMEICLELQYMLDEKYQGRGYGLEMCRAVLAYAFTRTDWERVWIRSHPANQASIQLAVRLGFVPAESSLGWQKQEVKFWSATRLTDIGHEETRQFILTEERWRGLQKQ